MRRTALLVPIGSFALAVLLSVVSAPASRQLLRAADAPTGTTPPPTPPCAKWELTKITGEAKNWALRVPLLESTLTNTERALGQEMTHTLVKAEVRGHLRGNKGWIFQELPGTYQVVIDSKSVVRNPGVHKVNLHVQSVAQHKIKDQIRAQFKNSQVDLLLAPIAPADVIVTSIDLIDQELEFQTTGFVYCIKSRIMGEFIPRPVKFNVVGGIGTGTR